jgi:phage terminase large subunit-like protein
MNPYGMEIYAEARLEQAREAAATRRLLRAARAGSEQPSTWRRWLRLDGRGVMGRKGRLAEAS